MENSTSIENIPKSKTLMLRELSPLEVNVRNEVSTYFTDANKFLKPTSRLVINKKIHFRDFKEFDSKDASSIHKDFTLSKKAGKSNIINLVKSNETRQSSTGQNIERENLFQILDNRAVKSLFENYKKIEKTNNTLDYSNDAGLEMMSQRLPTDIQESLSGQSRTLERKKKNDLDSSALIKKIATRIKKKESDVLMNRVDIYRVKRQIISSLPRFIKREKDKFSRNKWVLSLRRPSCPSGCRDVCINVKSDKDPFWVNVKEKWPIVRTLSIKPGYDIKCKEYNDFVKNPLLKSMENKRRVKTIENADDLSITGVDLLQFEYDNAMSSSRNKVLKKVFIENGKTILDKDISETFGYESIYKKYENNGYSRLLHSTDFLENF